MGKDVQTVQYVCLLGLIHKTSGFQLSSCFSLCIYAVWEKWEYVSGNIFQTFFLTLSFKSNILSFFLMCVKALMRTPRFLVFIEKALHYFLYSTLRARQLSQFT